MLDVRKPDLHLEQAVRARRTPHDRAAILARHLAHRAQSPLADPAGDIADRPVEARHEVDRAGLRPPIRSSRPVHLIAFHLRIAGLPQHGVGHGHADGSLGEVDCHAATVIGRKAVAVEADPRVDVNSTRIR